MASGVRTEGESVFAGHWLYKARTTLESAVGNASEGATFRVANADEIQAGQYVCIYRGNGFNQPEHCLVQAKNGNMLTLGRRGYKSTAREHAAGEFIAQHQTGNGGSNLNWAYNLSTKCPEDGAGNQANVVLARWISGHYDRDGQGNPADAAVHGILYDSDFNEFIVGGNARTRDCDADNDGTVDYGFFSNGDNAWGDGLELFYNTVRAELNGRGHMDALLLGGDFKSHGLDASNGSQMEAFPDTNYMEGGAYPSGYRHINSHVSCQKFQYGNGPHRPRIVSNQNKSATALHGGARDNRPARISMCLGMMFDGTASFQNGFAEAFRWWDEYAVDLSTGAAVSIDDLAALRAHKHWMGLPLRQYKRLYSFEEFADSEALFDSGDAYDSGWRGNDNVSVERSTDDPYVGTACLRVELSGAFERRQDNAVVFGPRVTLTPGVPNTLCFAIKAPRAMAIRPNIGGLGQGDFRVPKDRWSKQVAVFYPDSEVTAPFRFACGVAHGPFYLDQVKVFPREANVFRRDYENAVVLANATPNEQTVALGGNFRKIRGQQDASHNDGSTVSSVTLAPHDGIVLIRQ